MISVKRDGVLSPIVGSSYTAQTIPEIYQAFDHAFGLIEADLARSRREVAEKGLYGRKLIRDLSTYRRFQVNR